MTSNLETSNNANGTICRDLPWLARWPRGVSSLLASLLLAMFVLCLLDKRTQNPLLILLWVTVGIAAVTDLRQSWKPRLLLVASTLFMTLIAGSAAAWISGSLLSAWSHFLQNQILVLWFAVLWICTPLVVLESVHSPFEFHILKLSVKLLVLYGMVALISCFGSINPKLSMRSFSEELGPYIGLFAIICRLGLTCPEIARGFGRHALTIGGLTVLAMSGVVSMRLLFADSTLVSWMEQRSLLLADPGASDSPWRLLFPFLHHNRAAYFACCMVFLALAGLVVPGRAWRAFCGVVAILSFSVIFFTATRGALLACACGLIVLVSMAILHRRSWWWCAFFVILPGIWFLLPEAHRHRIAEAFRPAAYQADSGTTMDSRMFIWRKTATLVAHNPGLGTGYGFQTYEFAFEKQFGKELEKYDAVPHAHNQWLEITAETGFPAVVLFVMFTLARFWIISWALRSRPDGGFASFWFFACWLALEIAIQVYGLSNYPLRRGLGLLTYGIWAVGLVTACSMASFWPAAKNSGKTA
ncbi:MAG: O-antigen ligase family protein [Candidatus Sumerlaeaceae bacterium]|nr:O-antigen ligase family protein [Candidatus Sumerlaeaceae bacterium]